TNERCEIVEREQMAFGGGGGNENVDFAAMLQPTGEWHSNSFQLRRNLRCARQRPVAHAQIGNPAASQGTQCFLARLASSEDKNFAPAQVPENFLRQLDG